LFHLSEKIGPWRRRRWVEVGREGGGGREEIERGEIERE
jgi:hypothetical protein